MKYWIKRIPFLVKKKIIFNEIVSQLRHSNKKIYNRILPLISIEEITGDVTPDLMNNEFEDGNISDYELECICKIVKTVNPATIFEIGTFNGKTSLNMAINSSSETKVFTLDLPKDEVYKTTLRIKSGEKKFIDKEIPGAQFIGTPYEKKIFQVYGDSAKFDFSDYINKMDFVFIDGSHSYEYVVNDTKIALRLLSNGKGTILWHDYGWNEVNRAINELYQIDTRFWNLKNIKGTNFAYLRL
jgi:hypothetical protein